MHIDFWQNINTAEFAKMLHDKGVTKIIYLGFASNMCILSRPTGMIAMDNSGFSLYFIPEASAAVETQNTWQTQSVHKSTTLMISQSLASLIKYDDIISKL
jgi:nicotinamidase-related amidase